MGSGATSDTRADMLGAYIRDQRKMADLSLRQLSAQSKVSNAYLSQIERGLHQPSVSVLRSIAEALNLSAEALLAQAGLFEPSQPRDSSRRDVEAAIETDPQLTHESKGVLLAVYRSLTQSNSQPRVGNGPGRRGQDMTTPQEQYIEALRQGQQAVEQAMEAWTTSAQKAFAATSGGASTVNPETIIDQGFDLADQMLAMQRRFVQALTASATKAAREKRGS